MNLNRYLHQRKKEILSIIIHFVFISVSYSQNNCCSKVNNLNIRSEANIKSAVIGKLNIGDCKSIISIEGNWIEIEIDNSRNGFVSKEFVNLELTSDISELKKKITLPSG